MSDTTRPPISDLRTDYRQGELTEEAADADPFRQFGRWFDDALAAVSRDANAMTLATADTEGRPSARTVLLKGYDDQGFVFYTNFDSRKGRELGGRPQACLLFFWAPLERQVRIEGGVTRVADAEADAYFSERPLASRYGAWASPQSRPIAARGELEARMRDAETRFPAPPGPPRPQHWGGFRLRPEAIEFWQGRASRLHDRLLYTRTSQGWARTRLAP